jgi:hypothetical protein
MSDLRLFDVPWLFLLFIPNPVTESGYSIDGSGEIFRE